MKKILGLTLAALVIMGLVGRATYAYFTDSEQGTASIAAGTMMLDINGTYGNQIFMSVTNTFPGDNGTANVTLKNSGSIPGKLTIAMSGMTNVEGTDPRFQTGGTGDLSGNATMAIFIDRGNNGVFDTVGGTDIGLRANGTTYYPPTPLQYATWDSYANKTWNNVLVPMLSGNVTGVRIAWLVPQSCGNNIQGDSSNFTVTFTLKQLQQP